MASHALVKRSSDSALMPPPPPPKRIKRPAKVLAEEEYTDALSSIIARDFFPGLAEAQSQQEYLNALESRDNEWIASAGKQLAQMMTPGPEGRRSRGRRGTSMTPMSGLFGTAGETPKSWTGDTPGTAASTATAAPQDAPPKVDTNLSLSAFQTKYTSEDNESFYKLLDKQNEKRAEKYAWMWADNKIPAARQIAHRERQAQVRAAHDAQAAEGGRPPLAIEAPDTRRAMPDTWKAHPRNGLMFDPHSIEDDLPTAQQRAEDASRAAPKAVVYDNTRLAAPAPERPDGPAAIPPSPSLSAVRDAVRGRPRLGASEAGSVADGGGGATPRVNGYAFVDSREPSPEPAPAPADEDTDWSKLALGPGDQTPNPFSIPEKSSREALHHRMVDKVARGKRAEKAARETKTPLKTPVPKFSSAPGLTPAAQKLMGRIGGRMPGGSIWEGERTPRRREGFAKGWTPKPKATPSGLSRS